MSGIKYYPYLKTKESRKLSLLLSHMKDRCYNPKAQNYKYYGGRGIKICNEWLEDKRLFIVWAMCNGFKIGLSIERINVDGNYEPSNCKWITLREQTKNTRNSRKNVLYKFIHTLKKCYAYKAMNEFNILDTVKGM